MAFVIAEACIGTKDTVCVDACAVDCIHPKKNTTYDDARPGFDEIPQLYIDPVECIDCGALRAGLTVSAIFALDDLPEKWKHYTELNVSYVQGGKFTQEEGRQTQRSEVVAQEKPNHSPVTRSNTALPLAQIGIALVSPKKTHRCLIFYILRAIHDGNHFAPGTNSITCTNVLSNLLEVAVLWIPVAPDVEPQLVVRHGVLLSPTE